jgi:hypothetical protein
MWCLSCLPAIATSATLRFELDREARANYIAAHGPIRDPIPTQFALTLFMLSGHPRVP